MDRINIGIFGATAAIAGALCACPTASAQVFPIFGDFNPSTVPGIQRAIAGDLDGDSDADWLVWSAVSISSTLVNTLTWFENIGGSPPVLIPHDIPTTADLADYTYNRQLVLGDLDGDGDLDIATPLRNVFDWILLLRQPDGTYLEQLFSELSPVQALADLNGDARLDLILLDSRGYALNLGGSPPVFAPVTNPFTGNQVVLATGDIDADSDTDLLVADWNVGAGKTEIRVFENNGASSPSFTQRIIDDPAVTLAFGADIFGRIADMNGDGLNDLVVVWEETSSTPTTGQSVTSRVRWYRNQGGVPPTFAALPIADSVSVDALDVGFLNDDANRDIVISVGGVSVLCFESSGGPFPSFTERVIGASSPRSQRSLQLSDIDADGDDDVLGLSRTSNVLWLEQADAFAGANPTPFRRLEEAITASNANDVIESSAVLISSPVLLDLTTTARTIQSRDAVVRPARSTTLLGDGSALIAAPGRPVTLEGVVDAASGESTTISGDSIEASGLACLNLDPSASVLLDAGTPVDLAAAFTLGPGTTLAVTGDATVRSAAAFRDRVVSTTEGAYRMGPVRLGDIDGDGDLDFVGISSLGSITSKVQWFEDTDGTGEHFQAHDIATGLKSTQGALALADLDGDGDLDVLVAAEPTTVSAFNGSIIRYENRIATDGTFSASTVLSGLPTIFRVLVADLDHAAGTDLVLESNTAAAGTIVAIAQNATASSFLTIELPYWGIGIEIGDLTEDGLADIVQRALVVPTGETAGLLMYKNEGGSPPTFSPIMIAPGDVRRIPLTIGDLDADGDADIVIEGAGVEIFENLTGGASPIFAPRLFDPDVNPTQTFASNGAMQDFDLDGDLDLMIPATTVGAAGVVYYESSGAGFGLQRKDIDLGAPLLSFDVVDLGLDGRPDFVVNRLVGQSVGFNINSVDFLENVPSEPAVLDQSNSILSVGGALTLDNRVAAVRSGAMISSAQGLTITRTAALEGDSIVDASVANAGTIAPDVGATLTINGDLSNGYQDPLLGELGGTIQIDLADGSALTSITVSGEATLRGAFEVLASQGFNPAVLGSSPLFTAGSVTPGSRFDVALLPNAGASAFLSLAYDEGGLRAGERSEVERALATVSLQVNTLTGDVDLDPQAGADSGAAGVPQGATLADFDGDGDPDLLIALPDATNPTTATGSVVILYNADDGNPANGWEGFGTTLQITSGVGVNPSSVAVGRLDADAQPDIVVSNRGTPGNTANDTVSALLVANPNAASFSLSASPTITVGDEPADVIVADLDGDGFLDIATANAGSDSVSVGWNAGMGTGPSWMPVTTMPIDLPDDDEVPVSIRPGDANAGIVAFLATANSRGNSIGVVQINPDRSTVVLPSIPAGNAPVEVVVADFNLDGEDDIASVNRNGSSVTIVLGGAGAGPTLAMGLPSTLPIPTTISKPRSIAAGDFDADANGDIDLAILADGVVKVLRNDLFNGQLAFTPIPDQSTGLFPLLVRSGDLNADGRDDVVTVAQSTGLLLRGSAGRSAESVSILLAAFQAPACIGDISGDGASNSADFNILASNFGASVTPNTNGDLTGDGIVNSADFNILAGDFGCGG